MCVFFEIWMIYDESKHVSTPKKLKIKIAIFGRLAKYCYFCILNIAN